MKIIGEHCDRLTRLNVHNDAKEIDPAQIEEELDSVCMKIWGYKPGDIDPDLMSEADQKWFDDLLFCDDAEEWANERGYTLSIGGVELHDWETFVFMILSEERGWLTPEHKAAFALKRESAEFIERKKAGVIPGR